MLKKQSNSREFFIKLLFLLIGGLLSYFITIQHSRQDTKTRYLDVKVYEDEFSVHDAGIDKELKFVYAGDTLTEYSIVTIDVYNFSDKNYTDVPIYIELNNDHDLDFKVLSSTATGKKGVSEGIHRIEDLKPPKMKGGYKIGYVIDVVGSSRDSFGSIFSLKLFIKGFAPKHDIVIKHEQLNKRDLDWEEVTQRTRIWYNQDWFFDLILYTLLTFCVLFMIIVLRHERKKSKEIVKYANDKYSNGKDDFIAALNGENLYQKIFEEVKYIEGSYDLDNSSILTRIVGKGKQLTRKDDDKINRNPE